MKIIGDKVTHKELITLITLIWFGSPGLVLGKETDIPPRLPRVELSEPPISVAYGESYKGDEFMSYLRELGVSRTSLKIHWWMVERPNDHFDFSLVDTFLDQLDPGEEAMITVFTSSNLGATGGIGKGSPPVDYDEYHQFIFTLASHCAGRFKYWIRDPEPATPDHWETSLYREYVWTQEEFYTAVKDADPDAIVLGGGHAGQWTDRIKDGPGNAAFFEYFLDQGRDWFDVFDMRLYKELYTIPARVNWFRRKMELLGYEKPIYAGEYGGPHPCQFEGWDLIAWIRRGLKEGRWDDDPEFLQRLYFWIANKEDYFPDGQLMFYGDCRAELDAKRDRIHGRDLVQRTVIALASGVEKLWYWNLHAHWRIKQGPHLLFGKLRLADLKTSKLTPAYFYFKRMAGMLGDATSVEMLPVGAQGILVFKVERANRGDVYVVWHRRDPYYGEEDPPVTYQWPSPWKVVAVTDIFGESDKVHIDRKICRAILEVTDSPLFLENGVPVQTFRQD